MVKTITGTTVTSVTLVSGDNPVSVTGTIAVTSGPALFGPGTGTNSWTIDNAGVISSTDPAKYGIQLGSSGSNVGSGVVTNHSNKTISGGFAGVLIRDNNAATVSNSGTVAGGNYGVIVDGPGAVTNASNSSITAATGTQGTAIFIYGKAGQPAPQVQNSGFLSGGGIGVEEYLGGSVTNFTGGTIIGQNGFGIYIKGPGTVTNSGSINAANSYGVYLPESGSITNSAGGTISGYGGVNIGNFLGGPGTFTNAGTVIATGSSAHAVNFQPGTYHYSYRLIADPGAVFEGQVAGGGGTIELANGTGRGTLAGFGTSITNFSALQFDAGSDWTIAGDANGLGSLAITGLAAGDIIDLQSFAATGSLFASDTHTLTLTDSANATATLNFPDKSGLSDFVFAPDGAGGTDIAGYGTGQYLNWTAAGSGDWNTPTNWSAHSVPTSFDTAAIANAGSNSATIASGANNVVASLVIGDPITAPSDSLEVSGALDVLGTVTIKAGSLTVANSGTLRAAAINDDGLLAFAGNQLLDNTPVDLGGTLAVQNAGTLTLGTSEVVAQSASGAVMNGAGTITNEGVIDATGGNSLSITPLNFVNQGTINAAGKTLTVGNHAGSWSNTGSIIADAATLTLDGTVATGNLGAITGAFSVTEAGLLDNAGSTLNVGAGADLVTVTLTSGGIIRGGTIADQGGGLALTGGTLDGVTYQGPLELVNTGDQATVVNGLSVTANNGTSPGTIDITGDGATLDFVGAQSLDAVALNIGATGTADVLRADGGGTFTIGSGATIDTGFTSGLLASLKVGSGSTLDLDGVLNATSDSGTFTLGGTNSSGTFINDGVISVGNGDTLDVSTPITNSPGTAITGTRTIEANSGGVVDVSAVAVSTGQTLLFANGGGTLRLSDPNSFHASIAGIDKTDSTIDLTNFKAVDKSYSGGVLTLTDASKAHVSLNIPGPFTTQEFNLAPDGFNGTNITWTFVPRTFSWAGTTGDWSNGANWDLGTVPTDGDSALIAASGTNTITVDTIVAIDNLTLDGADDTLSIPATATSDVHFLQAGSIIINAGTLADTGGFAATQVTDHGLLDIITNSSTQTLDNTPLDLGGTLQLSSAFGSPGTLALGPGEVVTQDQSNALITSSGNSQNAVVNQGSIDAGFTGGTMTIAVPSFVNQGIVTVGNGETLDASAAIAGTNGTINVGTGGVAEFTAPVVSGQVLAFTDATGQLRLNDPTTFNATITGFVSGDTIDLKGITADKATWSGGTLTVSNAGAPIVTLSLQGDYTSVPFFVASDAQGSAVTTATCFAGGTRILTPRGEVAVERLHEGDLVQTISGRAQPISWIGHRRVDFRRHPNRARILPVRIAAHAFGPGRPKRDLLLSPDHAVFVEDVLIPIRHLINGSTVAPVARHAITYYHVELPRHDVLFANGMPAESYLEAGARDAFANGGGVMQLHPDFAPSLEHWLMLWEERGYAPLVVTGPALERARRTLACPARPAA